MYKEVYGVKPIERFYKHDYSSHYSDPIYEIFCYKTVKGKLIKHVEMHFGNRDMEYFVICPYDKVNRNLWSDECTNGFLCDKIFDNEDDCEEYCKLKNKELFEDYCYKFKDVKEDKRKKIISKLDKYGD